jgi:uncharacterized repeat protein (TIGR02543 family)
MSKMRQLLFVALLSILVQSIYGLSSFAWAQGQPLTFSAFGDIPEGGSNDLAILQQYVADHNRYSPSAFILHVGDILHGSCTESKYSDVANIMKGFAVPAYIVVGDNDYTDCTNPVQALVYWKKYFLNFEQNFCGAPSSEHQSVRDENFAFLWDGVLFVGINLVGGTVHDQKEWDLRMQDDAAWVSQQFQAKRAQVRAAVVFAQTGNRTAVDWFTTQFRASAAAFGKPVLYIHGDLHTFKYDQPWSEKNITRLEVPLGSAEPPLEVTVTMTTTPPQSAFTVKRNPWSTQSVVNMPPCANAGPDQNLTGLSATLNGQATDDGDPNGTLTTMWSKVSGPGTVVFGKANALTTTASFSTGGAYVLRLTADDGALQKSDDVTFLVNNGGTNVYSLTINTVGSGSVALNPAGGTYNDGTVVTLTATPVAGFQFNGWSGALTGSTNPATITMNANKSVTATFTAVSPSQFTLTANTVGSGSVDLNPAGGVYNSGTVVTLTATPAAGFQFSGWSGDLTGSTNPATLTMNANKSVTATFIAVSPTQFTLTTSAAGSGSVALNPAGGVYNSGTVVMLTATPAAGFQFSGWSGALTGSTNPATITMNANKSVTATFTAVSPTQFTLTTSAAGSGSVALNPAGGVYNSGTVVTLTATPAAGFQFSGWSGNLSGSTNPATITMNANKSVTATFTASGTDPNVNLAKGKPITASSTYSGKPATNAVDGSTSTYWRSGSVSSSAPIAWLHVDLGSAQTVGRAIVRWKETYIAKSYELQVSNDDVNWTTVYSTTAGASGSQQFTFSQTSARYVRFYMTKNSKSNYQIYELEVYSAPASTPKVSSETEAEAAIPGDFVLEQNYPNPFPANGIFDNPSTKISFGLPQASRVTIKVYTINGMEVKTLVDAQYSAGMHSVVFQPKDLPSGTYFYVMQAGDVRRVRQLMLVK